MNSFADRIGASFPLVQSGMGGIAGPELAAAVSNAGAAGVLALYRLRSEGIGRMISRTRALATRPFGVNLIPEIVTPAHLAEQIGTVLAQSDPWVFFTFYGLPDRATGMAVREAGRAMIIMVGSVDDARRAEALGADAIALQGTEAGGHLLGALPTAELLKSVRDNGVQTPLLATGGIGSGHEFRAIGALGAIGCVCGTLFVGTTESRAHPHYKSRLIDSGPDDTIVTETFDGGWPGRKHRVLVNALTKARGRRLPRQFIAHTSVDNVDYPIARYSAAVPTIDTHGEIDEMAMYCGWSVAALRDTVSAADRVATFVAEFEGRFPEPAGNSNHR